MNCTPDPVGESEGAHFDSRSVGSSLDFILCIFSISKPKLERPAPMENLFTTKDAKCPIVEPQNAILSVSLSFPLSHSITQTQVQTTDRQTLLSIYLSIYLNLSISPSHPPSLPHLSLHANVRLSRSCRSLPFTLHVNVYVYMHACVHHSLCPQEGKRGIPTFQTGEGDPD